MAHHLIDELRKENITLRARILELEKRLEFLGRHQTLARGIAGEKLISDAVGGHLTLHTAASDVVLPSGEYLEIKHSAVNSPHRSKNYASGRRWQWQKVLGEKNQKAYDYLILIGEVDKAFAGSYKDPTSPYVLFCIPRAEVEPLTTKGPHQSLGIRLGTNPEKLRAGVANRLYSDYQATIDELQERFGAFSGSG